MDGFPQGHMGKRETQTWVMRKNCYHTIHVDLQHFSKWFKIKTAHDPPQVGMGRGLVDYHLKSRQQSIRQMDMNLPVLVHGASVLKKMQLQQEITSLGCKKSHVGRSQLAGISHS